MLAHAVPSGAAVAILNRCLGSSAAAGRTANHTIATTPTTLVRGMTLPFPLHVDYDVRRLSRPGLERLLLALRTRRVLELHRVMARRHAQAHRGRLARGVDAVDPDRSFGARVDGDLAVR